MNDHDTRPGPRARRCHQIAAQSPRGWDLDLAHAGPPDSPPGGTPDQPRFAGPPAAGILRESSITGPQRSITGRYRDLSACGVGSGCHVGARVRTVPGNRYHYGARGQTRPGRCWHATRGHRASPRLGDSRLEVSLLPRLHRRQRVFQNHERILPQVSGLVRTPAGARTCCGQGRASRARPETAARRRAAMTLVSRGDGLAPGPAASRRCRRRLRSAHRGTAATGPLDARCPRRQPDGVVFPRAAARQSGPQPRSGRSPHQHGRGRRSMTTVAARPSSAGTGSPPAGPFGSRPGFGSTRRPSRPQLAGQRRAGPPASSARTAAGEIICGVCVAAPGRPSAVAVALAVVAGALKAEDPVRSPSR